MKKLVLKSIFDKGEVLTRAQLRKVMGGTGSGSANCSATCTCSGGQTFTISIGNCNGVCTSFDGPNGMVECEDLDGIPGNSMDQSCQVECLRFS